MHIISKHQTNHKNSLSLSPSGVCSSFVSSGTTGGSGLATYLRNMSTSSGITFISFFSRGYTRAYCCICRKLFSLRCDIWRTPTSSSTNLSTWLARPWKRKILFFVWKIHSTIQHLATEEVGEARGWGHPNRPWEGQWIYIVVFIMDASRLNFSYLFRNVHLVPKIIKSNLRVINRPILIYLHQRAKEIWKEKWKHPV